MHLGDLSFEGRHVANERERVLLLQGERHVLESKATSR